MGRVWGVVGGWDSSIRVLLGLKLKETQPPRTPLPAPLTPAPFRVLLLLKVGVARGRGSPCARALGAHARGLDRPGGPPSRVGSGPG